MLNAGSAQRERSNVFTASRETRSTTAMEIKKKLTLKNTSALRFLNIRLWRHGMVAIVTASCRYIKL